MGLRQRDSVDRYMTMSRIQEILQPAFETIKHRLDNDPEFRASTLGVSCAFSISSSENADAAVVVSVNDGQVTLGVGPTSSGSFGLQARNQDWDQFFAEKLVRPYQSYWGILYVVYHWGRCHFHDTANV